MTESVEFGRGPTAGVVLNDPAVSARHCLIRLQDGKPFIEDLDSTNGTEVNGRPVRTAELRDGDEIRLGETTIRVESVAEPAVASPGYDAHSLPPSPEPSGEHQRTVSTLEPAIDSSTRRMRIWVLGLRTAAMFALLGVFLVLFRTCRSGSWPCMVSAKARKAACRQMRGEGVLLSIEEPSGIARVSEPVTSGVPLPEGTVHDISDLSLALQGGQPLPCQFTALSRWPSFAQRATEGKPAPIHRNSMPNSGGGVKWVLLDFQADVSACATNRYVLRVGGRNAPPAKPVKVETQGGIVKLKTGDLKLEIATNRPGLIHAVAVGQREILATDHPVQARLVDASNRVFHASTPTRVAVESSGPMRGTVLVTGQFVGDAGESIHGGKVGYDLRIHAYAGKPYVRLAFTLKNDGWYGYRNEAREHPRQWLFFKSLRLDVPAVLASGAPPQVVFSGAGPVSAASNEVSLVQWYRYPCVNSRHQQEEVFDVEDELARERPAGIEESRKGFYWWLESDGVGKGSPGKLDGWVEVRDSQDLAVGMAVRRFWQNFPRGFSVGRDDGAAGGRLSFLMFPEGGFWPRTTAAHTNRTYQFEGGRHKTAELLLWFGKPDTHAADMSAMVNRPLFARAAPQWYRDTGAVLPLAGPVEDSRKNPPRDDQAEMVEAMERYDRLQRAKVRADVADPAGPDYPSDRDRWGKISIPALQDQGADVFSGWMNYGDLIWSYGYCSLYYEWPSALLQQYLRLGDRQLLDTAKDMVRHRYDIDQYHVENTALHLGGFQRAERGEHGHISRQEEVRGRNLHWEANCVPSHTWCRGLLLHWALTGDPRSLEAAEQNGRAYRRFFFEQQKLAEKTKLPYSEFRTPAWAMDNWMALYEYTGRGEYLEWTEEVFNKTLLAIEKDNGSRGHVLKDGRQSGQFTAYLVEPVCRLHHLTGRRDVIEFLERVLDWQRDSGTLRGVEHDSHYYPTLWREDWNFNPALQDTVAMGASIHYSIAFADGYAYLWHVLGRRKDQEFARKIFREFMFFYGFPNGGRREVRTPLGYHFWGSPFGPTPKIHGFSGRYGLVFLAIEEGI